MFISKQCQGHDSDQSLAKWDRIEFQYEAKISFCQRKFNYLNYIKDNSDFSKKG